jgi:predicted MFS family arabinose efflux permease
MSTCQTDQTQLLTDSPTSETPTGQEGKLPLSALLALATAAFITVLAESLPAGVLPEMAHSLAVSDPVMGQALTVYAVATAVSAIPMAIVTAARSRKRVLLLGVATITVANAVTAVSADYPLTMVFRLLAGVGAAAVWGELVGYARRLAPAHLQGRAITITMAGIPLALSVGIPLGTLVGGLFGWRMTFGLVTVVSVALLLWILLSVPDAPGSGPGAREPILAALRLPGVVPVLFVVATWVLAHNILYTYISVFLDHYRMGGSRDLALLVFGVSSVGGIWVTGTLIDRRLRSLTLGSTALFLGTALLLAGLADHASVVYLAMVLWGLGWGGVASLLQTAVTEVGGDRGQALLVTTWNAFTAAGGAFGGVLADSLGPASFPWSVLTLLVPALVVVLASRRHGFPAVRG